MMPNETGQKRIFEVARDLRIPTPEIIEYLTSLGHDVPRKQMQPVSEQMFIALLYKYDRGRFEQYLISHGITGEDIRKLTAWLEEQRRKASKPPIIPVEPRAEVPPPVKRRPKIRVERHARIEKREKVKVTIYRRERPPVVEPAVDQTPVIPINIYATLNSEPKAIPTTPLALELIQRLLALPYQRKLDMIEELRAREAA
jgi:hypothetical protein